MAYATVDELAAAVRTRVTETSTPILERCLEAATEEIDTCLGWPTVEPLAAGEVPALVHSVCLVRGVEWYKANDAALGVLGYNDTGALTPPASTFDRHAAVLVPGLAQTFGIA